jgi:hypothetical protein
VRAWRPGTGDRRLETKDRSPETGVQGASKLRDKLRLFDAASQVWTVWKFGGLEVWTVWKFGGLEVWTVWKFGGLEVWWSGASMLRVMFLPYPMLRARFGRF